VILSFSNLSIRKKLTSLMMAISVFILTLVGGLYLAEEIHSTRSFLEQEMTALGATLGNSSKKLLMLKEISTTKTILASVKVQPSIHAAYLFDESGTPVAQYLDAEEMQFVVEAVAIDFAAGEGTFLTDLPQRKISSSWRHFGLFLPIMHEDRQVGSLYLLSDLSDLYGRLNTVMFIALLLLGFLLFLSWWLSGWLQRPVSGPLLGLVETMGSISQQKNYSLRVEKQGHDEIGLLVDGFNRMLGEIENHRRDLVEHQESLESTVERRTEELRKMVSVLNIAKQQAEAASEAKSQFLANITHELRTPLVGVLGMNELLFRTTMDEQQKMLASTVQSSGGDLLTLINNVLDFSKIEAGKLQLEEAEFALYQVVEEVLNLIAGQAADKDLNLYSKISLAATCRVLGDELRLRQIVMNLVANAVKFTEQGSVTVSLDCRFDDADKADFVLDVVDTGIGMDEAAQEQIFGAFYQADASHTRKYGGTGLGLAIVLQLVELLGGHVELQSAVGQGSCFRIRFKLPLASRKQIALPESMHQQSTLIFSEDANCQQILLKRMTDLGLKVKAAESASDCFYRLNRAAREGNPYQFALFSFDAVLPDGQPLYQVLRTQPNPQTLRRILLLRNTQTAELAKQERKLFLPISWDRLHDVLCQSWHELHLVESTSVETAGSSQPPAEKKLPLLLAGGTVASRELIKLSLSGLPLAISTATNLVQLRKLLTDSSFAVTLVDPNNLPSPELSATLKVAGKTVGEIFVLFSVTDKLDDLETNVSAFIEKPFCKDSFLAQVQPLLERLESTVAGENA